MDGWLLGLIVVLVLGLAAIAGFRAAGRLRPVASGPIDPSEERELDEIFARVSAEESPRMRVGLARVLDRLVARQVPLRYVRASGHTGVARLGFADGTVVVGRAARPTGLAQLVRACDEGHVHPEGLRVHDEHVELELVWERGRTRVLVLGRDQAD